MKISGARRVPSGLGGLPRSKRSPSSVTRLEAVVRSSESIKQQRSMSETSTSATPPHRSAVRGWVNGPEFLRLKPLAVLPKDKRRLSGSIVRMSLSNNFRTSSFTASSSTVGRSWTTKSTRHWEKSRRNFCFDAEFLLGWLG